MKTLTCMVFYCDNFRQFNRMREWAMFLGLDWDYGFSLGALVIHERG